MQAELIKAFTFEAAHRNTATPSDDPRSRLHGHSYNVEIHISGEIGAQTGWIIDFSEIGAAFKPYLKKLDHYCLNDVAGFENTTTQDIEQWIAQHAGNAIPGFSKAMVSVRGLGQHGIQIPDGTAEDSKTQPICFTFAAAHHLPHVPPGHKCGRIHGHTYSIQVFGDGDVLHGQIEETYALLAYSNLNTISGLENPTSENLAVWLWDRWASRTANHDLKEIIIAETCTCRSIYRGR